MSICSDKDSFEQAKFIVLSIRTPLGQSNLLFRVTRTIPDMPLVFDWKQVFLSDLVFSQKLKLSVMSVNPPRITAALTTIPFEL